MTWIKKFIVRANWPWGEPPSWDAEAVDAWVQGLDSWAWMQMRNAWRSNTYRRTKATKRQVERAAELGLLGKPATDAFYEAYLASGREWKTFIDIMPKEMRGLAEMLHMREPDLGPWEAVAQMVSIGMSARPADMSAVAQVLRD